jgi:protein CpxP
MSRIAFRPIVASIALALATGALAAPAFAAVGDAPPAAATAPHHDGKRHDGHHWQGMRDGLWLPGIGPIGKQEVTQLKLDANQQALFKTAQDSQRDFFKSTRESSMARHKTLDDQLKAGQLDPHALATADVQNRQNREGQANQVRQNWLAVWDGLNDGQRQQVTQFVKARQAKWEAQKDSHKGGHHGQRPGGAPAPAPQSAS